MNARSRKLLLAVISLFCGLFGLQPEIRADGSEMTSALTAGCVPKEGFIPDERTAILVALAILSRIYGEQQINSELPLRSVLRDGTWIVEGTLQKDMAGGVAIIKLAKSDGRVLYVSHGK